MRFVNMGERIRMAPNDPGSLMRNGESPSRLVESREPAQPPSALSDIAAVKTLAGVNTAVVVVGDDRKSTALVVSIGSDISWRRQSPLMVWKFAAARATPE